MKGGALRGGLNLPVLLGGLSDRFRIKASSEKEATCELWVKIIFFTLEMKSSHCKAPADAGGSTSQEELARVHKYP